MKDKEIRLSTKLRQDKNKFYAEKKEASLQRFKELFPQTK